MDKPTDKLMISFQVTRTQRHQFRIACYKLGITMSTVLRDAMDVTIIRASAKRERQKGAGDG